MLPSNSCSPGQGEPSAHGRAAILDAPAVSKTKRCGNRIFESRADRMPARPLIGASPTRMKPAYPFPFPALPSVPERDGVRRRIFRYEDRSTDRDPRPSATRDRRTDGLADSDVGLQRLYLRAERHHRDRLVGRPARRARARGIGRIARIRLRSWDDRARLDAEAPSVRQPPAGPHLPLPRRLAWSDRRHSRSTRTRACSRRSSGSPSMGVHSKLVSSSS